MRMIRKQEGFTLVELLVAVMTGSIVTMAAATVLLLGLRLNHASSGTATRQNNARILLTVLETMAVEGNIRAVEVVNNDWTLKDGTGENSKELFFYSQAKQTVFTGDGAPLMEGVLSSYVDVDKNLLTVSVTTEDGTYMSSVFCRLVSATESDTETGVLIEEPPDISVNQTIETTKARTAFLNVLLSQYQMTDGRANPGLILDKSGRSTGIHYTDWYIGGYGPENPGWDVNTPWCACFVSWCLDQVDDDYINPSSISSYWHWYADVDLFAQYFLDSEYSQWKDASEMEDAEQPIPGDLVFFDWDDVDPKVDLQHVGVVLSVTDGYVYTIEGNSGGRVAIRRYEIGDDGPIIGYGVLDWKPNPPQTN